MDKAQMQKERDRLQAVLDKHNLSEPAVGRHASLLERIANLDRRIEHAPSV